MAMRLIVASNMDVYFRAILTEVSVYKSTGHVHPGLLWMREEMKCLAPWNRELWFGCEETPVLSNVMSTSIVAVGASVPFDFMGFERFGANAEERRFAILILSQVAVMLSGKSLWRN
jgi:hypothetical protein